MTTNETTEVMKALILLGWNRTCPSLKSFYGSSCCSLVPPRVHHELLGWAQRQLCFWPRSLFWQVWKITFRSCHFLPPNTLLLRRQVEKGTFSHDFEPYPIHQVSLVLYVHPMIWQPTNFCICCFHCLCHLSLITIALVFQKSPCFFSFLDGHATCNFSCVCSV
jgi:hypothetical protein